MRIHGCRPRPGERLRLPSRARTPIISGCHEARPFSRPPAVVLGLGQNGLATCRALGRVGIPVIGVDSDLAQPGARTRYCTALECADFAKGGPGLIRSSSTSASRSARRRVLTPERRPERRRIASERREDLEPYYHLSLPSKEVARLFLDKKAFYKLAIERGFRSAHVVHWSRDTIIDAIIREIDYPCSIKPYQPTANWRGHVRHAALPGGLGGDAARAVRR